jgi:hypothetical protein
MDISENSPAGKAAPIAMGCRFAVITAAQPQLADRRAWFYAARLAAIRAQISAVISAPYSYGPEGPHRRQRDEFILQGFAADAAARLLEAAT